MKHSYLLAVLVLGGCSVGPDYTPPKTDLPSAWVSSGDKAIVQSQDALQQQWWQNFHDPVLNQLLEKAIADNIDLKVAEARGARSSAKAALLPSGDAMASATREANQFAIPGNFPGLTKPFNIFESGFDASWELDLFGAHRREIESAEAQLQATESTRDQAVISLLAEVARTYVDMRRAQKQIQLTQDIIAANEKIVALTQERLDAGATTGLDLTETKSQLEAAQAQLPDDQNQLAQAEYSLDVLTGQQPGTARNIVGDAAVIPAYDDKIVLAAPAAVIANRPDILAAERSLAAATAEQGVALAQFFPDISLSGFIGLLNTHGSDFLKSASESWLAGSSVVWPILSYGKLAANMDTADAQQQEALTHYQKVVLEALIDVEKSVTAYTQQQQLQQSIKRSADHSHHAVVIEKERYKEGASTLLDVLSAQIRQDTTDRQFVEAEARTSQNLIAVYKSLGGGWQKPQ